MTITQTSAWNKLTHIAATLGETPLKNLTQDVERCSNLAFDVGGCHFDFAKQWVTTDITTSLVELSKLAGVADLREAMYSGQAINASENRAVLHPALRNGAPGADASVRKSVEDALTKMRALSRSIHNGDRRGYTGKAFTDVVHIGIGGSHLGPELVTTALAHHRISALRVHYVANIDANQLTDVLSGLSPTTTLFIIASKTFSTLETRINANSARSWFVERTAAPEAIDQHFIGVTSNLAAASEFGLDADGLLPMWDWVGGRYSLWSAVGLPILLSIGEKNHADFLAGARAVDEHFVQAPAESNVPLLSALFGIWNYNFLGANSLAVLSYDERLRLLPDYLQQLEMESNGKSIGRNGDAISTTTMPILWGGTGTRGQHAYHQLLHQGTQSFAADVIAVRTDQAGYREHHDWLLANALAQSEAMAQGFSAADGEPHRQVPGNHSSTTILLDTLGPTELGALLATYEHKVFCQGAIWGINSFDQWGVELGKQLAGPIHAELAQYGTSNATESDVNAATAQLIDHIVAK